MSFFYISFFILVGILFLIKISYVIGVVLSIQKTKGAIFVHTPTPRIQYVLENIDIKKGQLIVDLGCGDARLLSYILKKHRVQAVGYEVNPYPYIMAKIRSFFKKDLKIIKKDFFHVSLKKADIIFCYLFPDILKDLALRLKENHKKGALLISFNFPMPGYIPKKILRPPHTIHNEPIYIYRLD